MTYMVGAPSWWYVVDAQNSLFFTILVLLVDIPIMQIMFFIAGYFALPSLVKRGPARFIRDKSIRVGAPWLVGALLLAPPTAYLVYYTRAVPMSLLQFWASDFWTIAYQQSVYWFLGVLFFLFGILALAYRASERLRAAGRRVSMPSGRVFISFLALMSLGMFLMNQFFSVDTWYTRAYVLVFQPLRVPLYVGYFGLGIYAYLSGWFSTGGYRPSWRPWVALWLLSGMIYLANRLSIVPTNLPQVLAVQIAHAILFNAFCLSSLMAAVALFQQNLNRSNPFWSNLSAKAYGIYYAHPLVLYPLAYMFVPVPAPLFAKAPLVILLGILLSWAVSAFVLTKMPVVRRAFA
jgi:hypothetical protein